eukprot:Nk52_evm69s223 gene=Nk52_evmTU69s223
MNRQSGEGDVATASSSSCKYEHLSREELILRLEQLETRVGAIRDVDNTGNHGNCSADTEMKGNEGIYNKKNGDVSEKQKQEQQQQQAQKNKRNKNKGNVNSSVNENSNGKSEEEGKKKPFQGKSKKKGRKGKREFDWESAQYRYVALKFLYLGWDYFGLSAQDEVQETIEKYLFDALLRSCLIRDRKSAQYQRCGRTDKGVSAYCQVVTLKIRSISVNDLDSAETREMDSLKGKLCVEGVEEIDYVQILNRLLPDEIRVLAWAPVPVQFDSRFSCVSRAYRYYFVGNKMDIEKMKQACRCLEGTHDFRNFCRMDLNNNVTNFVRRITHCSIYPIYKSSDVAFEAKSAVFDLPSFITSTSSDKHNYEVYALYVAGTAFLWHQIRCMMGVLFLIGKGIEEPTVVKELLDIEANPSKPMYTMAPPEPLVLYDTHFNDLQWIHHPLDMIRIERTMMKMWNTSVLKLSVLQDMIAGLDPCCVFVPKNIKNYERFKDAPVKEMDGPDSFDLMTWKQMNERKLNGKYSVDKDIDSKPLLDRSRALTFESRVEHRINRLNDENDEGGKRFKKLRLVPRGPTLGDSK